MAARAPLIRQTTPCVVATEPRVRHSSPSAIASWLAALLVAATFLCVTGGIVAAWWPVAPQPPSRLQRFWPLADGTTLSYTVAAADGATRYQSSNVELLEGNEAGSQLPAQLLSRGLALTAGGAPTDDAAAMIERAQAARWSDLRVARVSDTEYAAGAVFTRTVGLYLVLPESVGLIAVDDLTLDPPLPILDLSLGIGERRETAGSLGDTRAYSASLTLEAKEPVETPAGVFENCLRVRVEVAIDAQDSTQLNWYCPAIGLARQESRSFGATASDRYELAGGLAPGLLRPAPLVPAASDVTARARGDDGALPALAADELAPLWQHRIAGANVDVTAPPLAAGELLIVGTANGGLAAIERASHEQRWHFQTGAAIVGAPVAADGVLYVGSADRRLYALDLASGAFRWAFPTRDAISASPTVAGETVYVASEDRNVYAVDAATGVERWRFTAGDAVVTAPRVAGDTLFVGADDGVLYALDAATGAPRWAFSAGDAFTSSPVERDGTVYAASQDGLLYALAAASPSPDGELRWSYDAREPIEAEIALGADTIYAITSDGYLHAVDLVTGAQRWRAGDGLPFDGAPLLAGERVLAGQGARLLAFAAADGSVLATIELGSASSTQGPTTSVSGDGRELFVGRGSGTVQVLGDLAELPWAARPLWQADELIGTMRNWPDTFGTPPVLAGERLVAVTNGGRVVSASLADGSPRVHGQLPDDRTYAVPPAADAATLYIIDGKGELAAFDLERGVERWRVGLGGLSSGAPALHDGAVLVASGTDDATVALAVDAATGAEIWRRELQAFDLKEITGILSKLVCFFAPRLCS